MKAKELLKILCKFGMADGYVYSGKVILESQPSVIEGDIIACKEYYYSFTEVPFANHKAIIETSQKSVVYLYSI